MPLPTLVIFVPAETLLPRLKIEKTRRHFPHCAHPTATLPSIKKLDYFLCPKRFASRRTDDGIRLRSVWRSFW